MVTVRVLPEGREISVKEGTKLSKALIDSGIVLAADCGQHGICGKCKVTVLENGREETRLACTVLAKNNITVLLDGEVEAEIDCVSPTPESAALSHGVTEDADLESAAPSHGATEDKDPEPVAITHGISPVVAAVDLGTTTIAASLLDGPTGERLSYVKQLNPQSTFGADVISRMEYALACEEQADRLTSIIRREIYKMLQKMMNQNGLKPDRLASVAVVGNPVMTHLFCGLSLKGLAKAPFSSLLGQGFFGTLERLDMECYQNAACFVPPTLGGHVGSDFFACIVAKRLMERTGNYLLMDIGTNGELGFCHNGSILVTSTAAGPAFEGAGIRQGMPAVEGAIYKACFRPETGKWDTAVIGNAEAKGICGSGLVDVAANLLSVGKMDRTGFLKENPLRIAGTGVRGVRLWQEDIRSLQMAKSAIHSGAKTLMDQQGRAPDAIMLCGDFANALDIQNARRIALLPEIACPVEICGNQALSGAEILCRLSKKQQEALSGQAKEQITHFELADSAFFEKEFIKNMDF